MLNEIKDWEKEGLSQLPTSPHVISQSKEKVSTNDAAIEGLPEIVQWLSRRVGCEISKQRPPRRRLKKAQLEGHQKFASPASRNEPNCWPSL